MDIKNYQNVVTFLQSYYAFRKTQDSSFSYEIWSKEIAFGSRIYLRHLVAGDRPLSEKWIDAFTKFFSFSEIDSEYFRNLVHYTQSKNKEQRYLFGKKLLEINVEPEKYHEISNSFEFLSDKFLPRLQTICSFADAPQNLNELAQVINLEPQILREKLNKLRQMGLISETEGAPRDWRVPDVYSALGHQEFYRDSLRSAEESIQLPFAERRFSAFFTALNEEEFKKFLGDFEDFLREQRAQANSDLIKGRRLYHMNFNFFPVSNKC